MTAVPSARIAPCCLNNAAVSNARPRRVMNHGDGQDLLDRDDLLLSARADAGHGVLSEPAANLRHRIGLGGVKGVRDLGMQGGGERQRLGGIDDHLRKPGTAPPALAGKAWDAHLLAGQRVGPVDPSRVAFRVQPGLSDHRAAVVGNSERRQRGAVFEVVVVGSGTVGFQVAASGAAAAPEQDHTTLHASLPHGYVR